MVDAAFHPRIPDRRYGLPTGIGKDSHEHSEPVIVKSFVRLRCRRLITPRDTPWSCGTEPASMDSIDFKAIPAMPFFTPGAMHP